MMNNTNPDINEIYTLVSVIVITYNSAEYVVETLESIAKQSYPNIELIISDDGSKDSTISVCENWLAENKNRFIDAKIITVEKNTGIPANCNRGVRASTGQWIKLIAGDDILMPNCLQNFTDFINDDNNIKIVISDILEFIDYDVDNTTLVKPNFNFNTINPDFQLKQLLNKFFGNSPTFFIHRDVFNAFEYDEKYPFMEDYPFAINAVKHGFSIYYLAVPTVLYRKRSNSAFNPAHEKIYSDFYIKQRLFDSDYRLKELPLPIRSFENYLYMKKKIFNAAGLNKNQKINRWLYRYMDYINPLFWISKIYKF